TSRKALRTEGCVFGTGVKMTNVGEVYECEVCGNKVKVVEAGGGTLVCCGQDMNKVSG
ncbi:MAG: desulfoferrodoxin FeS4 iron-binding domain-containing protein, partial [Methanomassiliicoccales archaeon]|nr:desulfoferrodoxin FeS4 iron-binding domain-containing protein [Methanomassiliicoccales archaeon]